jgi:hypothetical protein
MDLEKIVFDLKFLIESYEKLQEENKLLITKVRELEQYKPMQLIQKYDAIILEKQNYIFVLEKRINYLKKQKSTNTELRTADNFNVNYNYKLVIEEFQSNLDKKRKIVDEEVKKICELDKVEKSIEKGLEESKIIENNVFEKKKTLIVENTNKKQKNNPISTLGQKINLDEYEIVNMKAVSGKILEYYVNKKDKSVYKKIANGFIGSRLGNISDFNVL